MMNDEIFFRKNNKNVRTFHDEVMIKSNEMKEDYDTLIDAEDKLDDIALSVIKKLIIWLMSGIKHKWMKKK